jgi:hypothetical protein
MKTALIASAAFIAAASGALLPGARGIEVTPYLAVWDAIAGKLETVCPARLARAELRTSG